MPGDRPTPPEAADLRGASRLRSEIASTRRAVLVVNTRSRRGRRSFRAAERLLAERGFVLDAAHAIRDPARIPDIVAEAVAQGHRFIVVGGGDGTIGAIVGRLDGREVVLGVLPLGTANSFAKALGLPSRLERAADVLRDGTVATVDLGTIGDRHFANAAAIGLPADIARGTPHRVKRWIGRGGYLLVALARLLRHRPFRCSVTHAGTTTCCDALEVRIANGGYQGGVLVADGAGVATGDLVIRVVKGASKAALVRTWVLAAAGRPPRSDDVAVLRSDDVVIDADPPQAVSLDGEVVACTPIHARIAAGALMVMVPADRPDLD